MRNRPSATDHWFNRDRSSRIAECNAILAERGLPDDVMERILDDIAHTVTTVARWSARTKQKRGIHCACGLCPLCRAA